MKMYVVTDQNGVRHDSIGVIAIVEKEEEAIAIKENLNKRWDGCEGYYNVAYYPMEIGPEVVVSRYPYAFCKHEWKSKNQKAWRCEHCGRSYFCERKILPDFSGKFYWDNKLSKFILVEENQEKKR